MVHFAIFENVPRKIIIFQKRHFHLNYFDKIVKFKISKTIMEGVQTI